MYEIEDQSREWLSPAWIKFIRKLCDDIDLTKYTHTDTVTDTDVAALIHVAFPMTNFKRAFIYTHSHAVNHELLPLPFIQCHTHSCQSGCASVLFYFVGLDGTTMCILIRKPINFPRRKSNLNFGKSYLITADLMHTLTHSVKKIRTHTLDTYSLLRTRDELLSFFPCD